MKFIITFIVTLVLGIWLDGKFVDFFVSLFPASVAGWIPLIKFTLWVVVLIYTIFIWFIISVIAGMIVQVGGGKR